MRKAICIVFSLLIAAAAAYFASGYIKSAYSEGMKEYNDSIQAEVEARRAELIDNSVFREGVYVNNVSIGGMTYAEAKAVLKAVEDEMVKDVGFTLHYGDESCDFPKSYFSISYNTDELLGDAIMLATEGEPEFVQQQIDEIAKNGRHYDIECRVVPKEKLITSKINSIAAQLYVKPVNATFAPKPNSVEGTSPSYSGSYAPKQSDRFTFKEGRNGQKAIPEPAIEEMITRARAADYGDVTMEISTLEPDLTVDNIASKIVLRSHFESSYASGSYGAPNRLHNVIKACGLVNGTCVPPKDPNDPGDYSYIFSTNNCLGYRTIEAGWLPAPGFVDGGANSVDSPGGGVCHVSSTLYNTVIKADLNIVYRINHSSHVGYVPWGLDATIDSGRIDFKWSNNTKHNVYVFMWVDQRYKLVRCEIWGEPFPDSFDYIDFYAEHIEDIEPGDPEYIEDRNLEAPHWYLFNKAKMGYRYESFKQYYKNGAKVGAPVHVANSEYRMHPVRYHVWVGFDPAVDALLPENRVPKPSSEDDGT